MAEQHSINHPGTTPETSDHIEENAERFKQGASENVNNTRDKVDRAAAHLEHGMHRGTDKLANAAKHGREALDRAMDHAGDWKGKARNYVRDKPTQSLVIAVATGWLLSRMLRHRH